MFVAVLRTHRKIFNYIGQTNEHYFVRGTVQNAARNSYPRENIETRRSNNFKLDRDRSMPIFELEFPFFFRDKVAKNFPKFPFSHSLFSLSPAFFHSLLKMASFFSLVLFFFLLLLSFLYTTLFIVANCVNSDSDYYRDSISGRAGLRAFSPSVLVKRELHSRCSLPPLLSS